MDKFTVLATLREHEPELKAAGIVSLSLFGSVARGDESPQSDVDLMAEFDGRKGLSIVDMVGWKTDWPIFWASRWTWLPQRL